MAFVADGTSSGALALEQALDRLRLRGSVYCLFEGLDAWGLRLPAAPEARFHAVRAGKCWLRVEDDPPVPLAAGELVLLPGGERHDVLATPTSDVVDVMAAFGDADPYQKVFRMGAGEPQASLICGGFAFDDRDLHPLPSCLPRIVRLRADEPAGAVLHGLLDLAYAELAGAHLASDVVLGRLSEILFVAAVRTFAAGTDAVSSGWLAALRDPAVGAALAAMHAAPSRDWSVAAIAETAGVSKTTLTERFHEHLGMPPGRYLTRWRMLEARRLLEHGTLTVAEIADRVGYASEAAFSRAFQREVGVAPSEYRSAKPNA